MISDEIKYDALRGANSAPGLSAAFRPSLSYECLLIGLKPFIQELLNSLE